MLLCFLALVGCTNPTRKESEYNLGVAAYRLKDYASARQHWAQAVANEGFAAAYNNLGYLLYYGLGGKADVDKAVSLWAHAAQAGERESQWHLANAFEEGKGAEQSAIEAYAWYRCALAGYEVAPAVDDMDAQIARDANRSLVKLLPKLSPSQFEAGEKLAKSYIEKYAQRPANK